MNMIVVHADGDRIAINPNKILAIQEVKYSYYKDRSRIYLSNKLNFEVTETMEDIVSLIDNLEHEKEVLDEYND